MKNERIVLTNRHKELIHYLAAYYCVNPDNLELVLGCKERLRKQIMSDLNKLHYIIKDSIKVPNKLADLTDPKVARLRAARKVLQNVKVNKVNAFQYTTLLRTFKKYAGADWDKAGEEYIETETIYRLTSAGKAYAKNELGVVVKDFGRNNWQQVGRLLRQSNFALTMKNRSIFVELLPERYPSGLVDESERIHAYVPSYFAKNFNKSIGNRNRALGVLCGLHTSYAVYFDGNGKSKFSQAEECSIMNRDILRGYPAVGSMILLTASRTYFKELDTQITKVFDNARVRFHDIHIIENNDHVGQIIVALLHENWHRAIIRNTFVGKEIDYNVSGKWDMADAIVEGKYVFVMISHSLRRNTALLRLAISEFKLSDVIIICLDSQKEIYENQKEYPLATVVITPNW